jgi:ankyrin repeat protein
MAESDLIREFMIAAHNDLQKVKEMLAEHPDWININYDWGPGGWETPIQAGAHMGNREITEYLLSQGAPMIIVAAAMLGRIDDVKKILDADPTQANARGGHGIRLMFHAAMSGNVEVAKLLKERGCSEDYDSALHGAIMFGHYEMVKWLLENGAQDVNATDFQGKTPLTIAEEKGLTQIAELLRARGAIAS